MGCPVSKVVQDVEEIEKEKFVPLQQVPEKSREAEILQTRARYIARAVETAYALQHAKTARSWRRQWVNQDVRAACQIIVQIDKLSQ